ncbi:MAG TPA: hypothetical protein PKD61_09715, partial [Polyangiaceae bacterium]|nr:hypothetical protein [Polyangiaceae bacterium]
VRRRAGPIFMSTFTSLTGLVPMVLRTGDGSELYRGIAPSCSAGWPCAGRLDYARGFGHCSAA